MASVALFELFKMKELLGDLFLLQSKHPQLFSIAIESPLGLQTNYYTDHQSWPLILTDVPGQIKQRTHTFRGTCLLHVTGMSCVLNNLSFNLHQSWGRISHTQQTNIRTHAIL